MRKKSSVLFALAATAVAALAQDGGVPQGPAVRAVVTAEVQKGASPHQVTREDVLLAENKNRIPVGSLEPVATAGLQLWIIIDDGTDASVANQFPDIRKFILDQPASTQIGVGYMRNGSIQPAQALTGDHRQAAQSFRIPLGQPGIAANPYSAITDLIHSWPAGEQAREILLIGSGIDPEYGPGPDDPFLLRAIDTAQRSAVVVTSIYFGSAGHEGHSYWQINWGQNNLSRISEETGGEFYWQGELNPVAFAPFLSELEQRLSEQFLLTFRAEPQEKGGFQRIKLSTEVPHIALRGPAKVYIPGANGK